MGTYKIVMGYRHEEQPLNEIEFEEFYSTEDGSDLLRKSSLLFGLPPDTISWKNPDDLVHTEESPKTIFLYGDSGLPDNERYGVRWRVIKE